MAKIFLLILFFFSEISYSAQFDMTWDLISGAQFYEYEIHKTPESTNESLLYSGRTELNKLSKELNPGVYFIRVRGIDKNGKAGDWSSMLKYIVKGKNPEIVTPQNGKIFEQGVPVHIEWHEVDGASDYRVILISPSQRLKVDRVVTTPTTSVKTIPPGEWKLQIFARQGGQNLYKSNLIKITVKKLDFSSAKPVILEPQSGSRLAEKQAISVVWHRRLPGTESVITIKKVGGKFEREFKVPEGNELKITDVIPKGTYTISVRNLVGNLEKSVEDEVTIGVGEEPLGVRSKEFRFRSYGGFHFGKYDQSNFFFPGGYSSESSFLTSGGEMLIGLSGREALNLRGYGDIIKYKSSNLSSDATHPQFMIGIGINHLSDAFTDLSWKFFATLNRTNHMVKRSTDQTSANTISAAYSIGFMAGFEKTFGGEKSTHSFPLEFLINFPVVNTGSDIGGGKPDPFYLPSFVTTQIFWRWKIANHFRTLFGPSVRYHRVQIEEEGQSAKTKLKSFNFGAVLGFEYETI